jgi:hypothetical protein
MPTTTTQPLDTTSQTVIQPHAGIGLAIVRLTIGTMFVWVFFENLGKGLYTPGGFPCFHGGATSGMHRNFPWGAAAARPLYASGCARRICVPRQLVDFGVGHGVDLGTPRFRPRLACACRWKRGPHVGC